MRKVDTVVIGAGIAGLTAAWTLQRRGRQPLVLEAAHAVGGRMGTQVSQGFLIDTGAQFLSTGYRIVCGLAAETGVPLAPVEPAAGAVLRNGRLRPLRSGRAFDALRTGLLGWRAWFRLGRQLRRLDRELNEGSLANYAQWAEWDDMSVAQWLRADREALESLYEPLLEGFYFQQAETTSRALALMASAFGWRGATACAPVGGMGALPAALAARLTVRCSEPAVSLREVGDGVLVETAQDLYHARKAICAVPALQARALWPYAPDPERSLMQAEYSSSITVALMTGPDYRLPPAWSRVYGALVPRGERGRIAALTVEACKGADRSPTGQLVNAMLDDAAARECMGWDDDALFEAIAPELEARVQGLPAAVVQHRVFRWPLAEPRSPVGRAQAIAAYREGKRGSENVLLAGDYLGAPFTEGAAESGRWAAETLG